MTELETKTSTGPTTADDAEYVAEDDTIIGQAFKWSLGVIAVIALVVVASLVVFRDRTEAEPAIIDKDPGEITGIRDRVVITSREIVL